MTIVLVTRIKDDIVGDPVRVDCRDYDAAKDVARDYAGRMGYVGCIKVKGKIKWVF
jgi:hypothetical protein